MIKEYPQIFHDVAIYESKKIWSNDTIFIVGSKILDRAIKVEDKNIKLVEELLVLLDGNNSIEKIREALDCKNYSVDIVPLIELFARNGFIIGIDGVSNSEVDLTSRKLIDIPFLKSSKYTETICKCIVRCIPLLIICLATFLIVNISYFNETIIVEEVFLYSFLTSILAMAVHEIGHIVYALSYGIKVSRVRISLLWGIMPMAYIKYNNLYFIEPKIRLGLILSGVVSNLFFSLVAFLMYYLINSSFAISFLYVNIGFIFVNLLPHQATDGYFALSTLFNKNNIRLEVIQSLFKKKKDLSVKLKIFVGIYIVLILTAGLGLGKFMYSILMQIFDGRLQQYSMIVIILISLLIILQFVLIYIRLKRIFNDTVNKKES